jgi:hypothetical protein
MRSFGPSMSRAGSAQASAIDHAVTVKRRAPRSSSAAMARDASQTSAVSAAEPRRPNIAERIATKMGQSGPRLTRLTPANEKLAWGTLERMWMAPTSR